MSVTVEILYICDACGHAEGDIEEHDKKIAEIEKILDEYCDTYSDICPHCGTGRIETVTASWGFVEEEETAQ